MPPVLPALMPELISWTDEGRTGGFVKAPSRNQPRPLGANVLDGMLDQVERVRGPTGIDVTHSNRGVSGKAGRFKRSTNSWTGQELKKAIAN
jgi:hypothetical protein